TASGLTYYRLEPPIIQGQTHMDNIDPGNIDSLIATASEYLIDNGTGEKTFNAIVDLLTTLQPVSVSV
uniref:hypothetical protein n=1 Tax=Flavobacterium sp. TaxID=239 RepID=UPI0026373B83